MRSYNQIFGTFGEDEAVKHLEKKRYKILKRNYKNKFGEIDIIAEKKGEISFFEVKTRKSDKFGKPYEAVNLNKQRKIVLCAKHFLSQNNLFEKNVHFDVIEVYGSFDGSFFVFEKLNHIKDAIDQISQF